MAKGREDFLYTPTGEFNLTLFPGSKRRCGGQGDLLAGVLATLLSWMPEGQEATISACQFATNLIRIANESAFEKYQLSMNTSDMIQFIGIAFQQLLGMN